MRTPRPNTSGLGTPRLPGLDERRPPSWLPASEPPATKDRKLQAIFQRLLYPQNQQQRAAAWKEAVHRCIRKRHRNHLEWLSLRFAFPTDDGEPPHAELCFTDGLTIDDLRYVLAWRETRENKAPLQLKLEFSKMLSDADVQLLVDLLGESTTVRSLKLIDCGLTDAHMSLMAEALKCNRCLGVLDISYNGSIGHKGLAALASALKVNATLRQLVLNGYKNKGGLAKVFKALKANTSLEKLSLVSIEGSSLDGAALGQLLCKTQTLKWLDLSWARFTAPRLPRQIKAHVLREISLPDGIARNQSLTHLALLGWGVDGELADAVATLLASDACRLVDLSITSPRGWPLRKEPLELEAALDSNHRLQRFKSNHERLNSVGQQITEENLRRLEKLAPQALSNLIWELQGRHIPTDVAGQITHRLDPESMNALVIAMRTGQGGKQ